MSNAIPKRRSDLDALRVFGCYLLFLFHVGMVFNPAPFFHVRNDDSSIVFLILCGFIGLWHMPLLFLLAGWSAAVSLRSRGVGAFLRERGRKLALPLVTGCVLFAPGIKFLELRSGQDLNHRGLFVAEEVQESMRSVIPVDFPRAEPFDESFLEFLPTFFTHLDRFTWSHLWFVAYLLTFTLVLLPLFAPIARRARRNGAELRPARVWIYLPIAPLVGVQLLLRERFPGPYNLYNDWANVAYYLIFLGSGFALALVPALESQLRAEWRRALTLGVVATGALLAAVVGAFESTPVVLIGAAIAGWCFVVALLGAAQKRVTQAGPGLRYLAESAFPIYVLHQPVVVALGAGVVLLPVGIAPKFVLLLGGSIAVTLALYHFGVRRFGPARVLLGLKPRPRAGRRGAATPPPRRPGSRGWVHSAAFAILALPLWPEVGRAADPTGLWWADGGFTQVKIRSCGDALCGRVVWLRHPFDPEGCALRDAKNPDSALRNRPVVGMEILRNLRPAADDAGTWDGGEAYDPASGRSYGARIQMVEPDRLTLRGYLGIRLLGRTTTWNRVGAERQCREGG